MKTKKTQLERLHSARAVNINLTQSLKAKHIKDVSGVPLTDCLLDLIKQKKETE